MKTSDVVVVGGGVIGCSVAYFLAREGLSVTLFERDDLAAHASGAAAGMLAPICESTGEGPLFELGLHSLSAFPELVSELCERGGIDPQYVASGILRAAFSEEEERALHARAGRLAPFGVEWLDASGARAREPHLAPDVRGALWSPREGHVYSPHLTRAYGQAAGRAGARFETGVPVLGLIQADDRILGVRTATGHHGAGHVVLCAGPWTRFCAEWLGESLPLEPVRGQIIALDTPRPPLRGIVWSEDVYLVPKLNGSVIAGATTERAGFDCRTTASGVASLLAAAPRLVPALAGSAFLRAWAGLRPATPDGLPVIGPIAGLEGVTLATGHYRNGVLLSPVTGQLVAGWVARGELPAIMRPLLPERLLRPGS